MFQEPGQASSAPAPTAPLGTLTNEQREAEIKNVQNDAISRAQARRDLEKRAESDETGSITQKELQAELAAEREAIQAEAAGTGTLGAGFFGTSAPLEAPKPSPNLEAARESAAFSKNVVDAASIRFGGEDEGDEVTVTKGEEMYGKSGQFSTYRVGPFTSTTKVRAGETRVQARRRLMDELNAFADEEREKAKKAFLSHYPNAFS